MKKIFFPYTVIEVHLEPIQFFIEKLERGENYHFLRINHGIIDQFVKVPQDRIEKLVEDKNYDMLSEEVYNSNEVYRLGKSFHGESETIIDKLKAFTRLAFDKNLSSRFLISASVDIGLDTVWGRKPEIIDEEKNTLQVDRQELVNYLTTLHEKVYHSGILKHFDVMDETKELFNFLNKEDYTTVFLGPDYFKLFEERFAINKFYHISTPPSKAIDFYDKYIQEIIDLSKKEKIFLFHASGHIASFYLAEKIQDCNFSAIDIGRSLDWAVKDKLDNEITACEKLYCWARMCKEEVLKNYIQKLRNG
jgi:hypothetical protein